MFCNDCGGHLTEGARFCGSCGAPINQRASVPQPAPQITFSQKPAPGSREAMKLSPTQTVVMCLVVIIIGAVIIGVIAATLPSTTSTSGKDRSGAQASTAKSCAASAQAVNDYDILKQGASRKGYLTLLHTLQRDCPQEAKKAGLTGDYMAKCTRLNQENCTMYAAALTLPAVKTRAAKHALLPLAAQQKVRAILLASISHYEHLLQSGKRAIGTTQYANGNAGLAAFTNPHSEASRFRTWRKSSNAERDISFFRAFADADNYYTASNEPSAIDTWCDDMSDAQQSLYDWVHLAASWQIGEGTTAQLVASEKRVEHALARARADVAAVLAGR